MPFNQQQAEQNLRNVLQRIERVEQTLENEILEYRNRDRIENENDEYSTMRDVRDYVLRAYRELDQILYDLDKYK